MRRAHFKVHGGPFGRPRDREATLTVEGDTVRVRPKHSRRTYDLPMDRVAKWVVESVLKAEAFKVRMEKARERAERRRLRRY